MWGRNLRLGLAILAAAAALSGCGGDDTGPSEFSDPSVPIRVQSAHLFEIVLESNATTGYSWRLGALPNPAIVKLRGSTYEAPQPDLVGAPGKERWQFQAMGRGDTSITLEYVRSWEEQPPAQTLTFQVTVT